jgi:hypothetical protein
MVLNTVRTGARCVLSAFLGTALFLVSVSAAMAQEGEGEPPIPEESLEIDDERSGSDTSPDARLEFGTISAASTAQLVLLLERAGSFCSRLEDDRYQTDCLADQMQQIADKIALSGGYGAAGHVIRDTARELRQLAEANAAADARPARLREVAGPQRSSRSITPVAAPRKDAVEARAAEILEEGRTRLLRSGEQSERRKVAYNAIAATFETNKILLRSA